MRILSFEGIEGVGKSTQINLLKDFLEKNKYIVEVLREPGSTPAGENIRNILLDKDSDISLKTELLLMFAARSELISKKINTLSCDYLLLDRFFDASLAYQGYGRNLPLSLIKALISLSLITKLFSIHFFSIFFKACPIFFPLLKPYLKRSLPVIGILGITDLFIWDKVFMLLELKFFLLTIL